MSTRKRSRCQKTFTPNKMPHILKTISVKLLILALLVVGISATLPTQTAYAAKGGCPEGGWEELAANGAKCVKDFPAGETPECVVGWTPAGAAAGQKLTCNKLGENPTLSKEAAASFAEKIQIVKVVQDVTNRLLWPVLVMTGGLLDNSLLFGNGMEERLRDIWIPIRNLVNMLFVIILVGIALYNVLGLGEDNSNYSIKSTLPKIIVGIIAINFSFLGMKVFLDGVNVLTASIFSLPTQVGQGLDQIVAEGSSYEKQLCAQMQNLTPTELGRISDEKINSASQDRIYQNIIVNAKNGEFAIPDANLGPSSTAAEIQQAIDKSDWSEDKKAKFQAMVLKAEKGIICNGSKLSDEGRQFLNRYGARNAALALALNMGKIVFYQDIDISVKNIEKLLVNTIFSMVLYIVYAVSFIALFVVLLGRLVVLWLAIAVSPILLLLIFAPDLKSKLGGFGDITDKFVTNAIAPLMISLSLTVGWIMLNALQNLNAFDTGSPFNLDPTNGFPVAGLNTIQDATVAIATIAVVWMGVFTASEGTIAAPVTSWLGEKVKSAGTFLARIPLQHAPIFPIKLPGSAPGEPQNYSAGEVARAFNEGMNRLTDDTRLAKAMFPELAPRPVPQADALRGISTSQELISHFGDRLQNGRKLDTDDKRELARLMGTTKGAAIATQLRQSTNAQDRDLVTTLDQLRAATTPEQFEAATKAMRKHQNIDQPPRTPQAAANPNAPGAATNITNDTTIGEASLSESFNITGYKTANAGKSDADGQAALDASRTAFEAKIKALPNMDRSQLDAQLPQLRFNGYNESGAAIQVAPTPAQIKEILGEAQYNKVLSRISETEMEPLLAPAAPPAPPAPSTP